MFQVDVVSALINSYLQIKSKKLEIQRQLDAQYQEELKVRDQLIALLSPHGEEFKLGQRVLMIKVSVEPFISNFDDLAEYIRKENALDLLQKRLTPNAVKLRWRDGVNIPGIGKSVKKDLVIKE